MTQSCDKTLLVVLRDTAGVDYIADSHVLLSSPYEGRVYVPLNQFNRAGWCAVKDKALDLTAIKEIRIGWGGYLGTESETVSFVSGAPCIDQ